MSSNLTARLDGAAALEAGRQSRAPSTPLQTVSTRDDSARNEANKVVRSFLQRSDEFPGLPSIGAIQQAWHMQVPTAEELLGDPVELFAVFFVVAMCLYSLKVLLIDVLVASSVESAIEERDNIANDYNLAESRMRAQLKRLEDSPAMVAEQTFQGHALTFQRFLDTVARSPDTLLGQDHDQAELRRSFRKFVHLWLRVFEQCSVQPTTEPRRVVKEAELSSCSTPIQVAKLISRRMAQQPVRFVSKTWDSVVGSFGPVQQAGSKAARTHFAWVTGTSGFQLGIQVEGKGRIFPIKLNFGCFTVVLLSWFHVRVLIGILVSNLLIFPLVLLQRFGLVAGAVACEVLLLLVLCFVQQVETRCTMEMQALRLATQREAAAKKEKDIQEQCKLVAAVTTLWRYRTMPHLSLFKQLSEQLPDTPNEEKATFLNGLSVKLDALDSGMGELWMWQGQHALEEESLKLASQQMKEAAQVIKCGRQKRSAGKLTLERLDGLFGFLAVRVVSSRARTLKGQTLASPHIVVKLGAEGQGQRSFRAKVGKEAGARGPIASVTPDDAKFELEVWGGSPKTEDAPIGMLHEAFRHAEPGAWQRRREKLYSFGAFQSKCIGEIEFEYYFADSVRLLERCWTCSPETGMINLDSFLGK